MENFMSYLDQILDMQPCRGAREWLKKMMFDTLDEAWAQCPNGGWLLWYIHKTEGEGSRIALAAADVAEISLEKEPSVRGTEAIDRLRKWANGWGTVGDLHHAAARARAETQSRSAYAASCAVRAAYDSYVADQATYDMDPADLLRAADIVRKHYPTPPSLP